MVKNHRFKLEDYSSEEISHDNSSVFAHNVGMFELVETLVLGEYRVTDSIVLRLQKC